MSRAFTRILAVDYGAVRVGLAVSDVDRKFAFPLEVIERKGTPADADVFRAVIQREEVGAIVVGLPVHLSGDESPESAKARAYGAWLASITALPVTYYDERFTSVQAEAALWDAGLSHKKRKSRRDKVAAQILLQAYLDAGCPTATDPGPLAEPPEPDSAAQ